MEDWEELNYGDSNQHKSLLGIETRQSLEPCPGAQHSNQHKSLLGIETAEQQFRLQLQKYSNQHKSLLGIETFAAKSCCLRGSHIPINTNPS